jgi:CubicO group peptidase (beta-lactamase class C family)
VGGTSKGTTVAIDQTERVRAEAGRLLAAGVAGGVFPGGTACVSWRHGDEDFFAEASAGRLEPNGLPVTVGTPYDLASLTKPIVAMTALRLVAAERLDLAVSAESYLSDAKGTPGGKASVGQLLSHRSGLAAWGGLYLDLPHEPSTTAARRWMVGEAARRPEEGVLPGTKAIYSDLGYLLAGEVLARASGQSLDRVVSQTVDALGLADQLFFVGGGTPERRAQIARRAAPTEFCEWRGRIVRGEVHDENAAALGGVAGHAGLFGTASGVAKFGKAILDSLRQRSTFVPHALIEKALEPRPGGTFRLGWDSKSPENSSAGRRMSPNAFGHLGFTGTSIWIDPERDAVFTLLTNRVHPSRANEKIKAFRPAFHDALVACL